MPGLFEQPQFPPVGMPQNAQPDMSAMYLQGQPQPQVPPGMPMGQPPQMPQNAPPEASYTGNPLIDKYIHSFIGA